MGECEWGEVALQDGALEELDAPLENVDLGLIEGALDDRDLSELDEPLANVELTWTEDTDELDDESSLDSELCELVYAELALVKDVDDL